MKQRKTASIIFAAGMLLLAGCQKDDLQGRGERMMLNLEAFGSGSKTVLGADDRSLQWLSGDQVRINGVDYTVSTSGDEAYVSDVPEASSYKALFPASMAEGRSMSGTTVTATLPRQYEYRTVGGLQVLDAPLAAVGDGSEGLTFLHLTGALTVVIENTTSNTLYIDSVVLSSAQQLCGDITVDFDNLTAISPNTLPSNPEDTMVLLTVPYNTLSVAAGEKVKVQIPVLPVSDANRFSVHVATRYQGTRYDFDRRQGNTSNALARNEMGYVPASIATSGTYISVRPLFDYDQEPISDNTILIHSKLDVQILSEATQGDGYSVPQWESIGFTVSNYKAFENCYFDDIDMEGAAISTILFNGSPTLAGKLSNVTVNGCGLFGGMMSTDGGYIDFDLENITINADVTSGGYVGALSSIIEGSVSGGSTYMVAYCNVSNVTFNLNCRSGSYVYIGGLFGSYWEAQDFLGDNIVNNIHVNFTNQYPKNLYFGGLVGSVDGIDPYVDGTYSQNEPLSLQATNVYYGGLVGDLSVYDYSDFCPDDLIYGLTGSTHNNVVINATNELYVGGAAGKISFYQEMGSHLTEAALSLNGTIDGTITYNTATNMYVDPVVPRDLKNSFSDDPYSVENFEITGSFNTTGLTLTQQ